MDNRELRIGNKVLGESDRIGTITDIQANFTVGVKYGLMKQRYTEQVEDVNGIPLDESLLLKCGFVEKYDITGFYILKDWGVYYCTYNKGIRFIDKGWICDVQYLHQLMNLYYVLTGEELEAKEL